MKRTGGPKWIGWAAIVGTVIFGVPIIIWVCLPVKHGPGPLQLYAKPTRLFSTSYEVTLINEGPADVDINPRYPLHLQGEPAIWYATTFTGRRGHGWQQEQFEALTSRGHKLMTCTPLSRKSPRFGLRQVKIVFEGISHGFLPQTEGWVFDFNDKTYTIK